ncbi:hypothetical protein [Massilia sp. Se16.2.3]|nr:hypothetical protein [Massilia sp. Se16.2.3]QNA99247.1 hypothetical protein G4G31_10940 [Massilia sp. Se16.2.3]
MLEADPPAAAEAVERPASEAAEGRPQASPAPEPVVERAPSAPVSKPPSRTVRKQSASASKPVTKKEPARPVRQVARASAVRAEKPTAPDTSMTATLKACREHGYHAAQCIKQGCSVTEYGFVCRGR